MDSDLELVEPAQEELSSSPIPAPTARPPRRSRKGRPSSSPASSPPPPPARRAPTKATEQDKGSGKPAAKPKAAPAAARPRPKPKAKAVLPVRPDDDDFFNMGKRPVVFRTKALGLTELAESGSIVRASTSRSPNPPQDRKSKSRSIAAEPEVIDLDSDSDPSTDEDDQLSGDDDEDDEERERRRRTKAKAEARKIKMPTWTRSQPVPHEGSSSDIEVLVDPEASPPSSAASRPSPTRSRKRSRSPTPPPRIDQTLIARDLEAVRDNLIRDAHGYVKGQSLLGRDQDDELMRLMRANGEREDDDPVLREVRQRLLRQQQERESADGASAADKAREKGVLVKVTVSMTWDPRNDQVPAYARAQYEQPFTVELGTREILRAVFERLSKQFGIAPDALTLALAPSKTGVLGKRVFSGETLESVGVYGDVELKCYRSDVYAYLREQRSVLRSPTRSPARAASSARPEPGSPSATVETLTITVRRGQERDLDLTVKKTTSVLAIIKQFLKEDEGLLGEALTRKAKRCTLEFDGERLALESKVGETELDDGDLCDVVVPDR